MKQILQNLGSGETLLAEVPAPRRSDGSVLIQTSRSLVSLGTEKMLIDFGKGSLIAKARSQPDKVKQVLQKIKTDGLWTTIDAVKAKLDQPIPLGYCNVGKVLEVSPTSRLQVGDRIASNGNHAEQVVVPENLTARIPDRVSDEMAAFTVVGAIGLQGIRLINPSLGERVVVSGLGLIGLLAVQILQASGCQVLGIDFDAKKLELARHFGAETVDLSAGQDPIAVADNWTSGVGVDAVLVTASAKTDEIMHQCATMCRQRGRIVLVGVVGLGLQRADFYEKELSFQVSCSYGPGRYDANYEKRGLDYPIGFVRWTEKRNFEAILQLMADGKIDVEPLITHRVGFDEALSGYEAVSEPGAMGILLEYSQSVGEVIETSRSSPPTELSASSTTNSKSSTELSASSATVGGVAETSQSLGKNAELSASSATMNSATGDSAAIGVAFIGAGGFTTRMLMPLLPNHGVRKQTVVSSSGVSAAHAKTKFGFANAASEINEVLRDEAVDAVFITTPHNLHASMVCDSLRAGKHVFVEKPLALNLEDLANVEAALDSCPDQMLMIGFNRRFSPHSLAMKQWLAAAPSNKSVIITVNAGAIPADHWTQDPDVGGGRIVGEACHFIDLARYLVDSPIQHASAFPMVDGDGRLGDCVTIQMTFADGSTATVHYLANGSKDFPKERIEVFAGGKVLSCDNFRFTKEIGGNRKLKTKKQDKGHASELKAFIDAIRTGRPWPISREELIEVSRVAIECQP